MIEESRARELAEEFAKGKSLRREIAIAPSLPCGGTTVACSAVQSATFLRAGNWRDMAVGIGPVAVNLVTGATCWARWKLRRWGSSAAQLPPRSRTARRKPPPGRSRAGPSRPAPATPHPTNVSAPLNPTRATGW